MKRKISLLLALVLVAIPLSFSHAETNDYTRNLNKLEKYASEIDNYITNLMYKDSQILNNENNSIKPSYVEHHNCFRGGTSCAHCYTDTKTDSSCGCVIDLYKCCCGSILGATQRYCKVHR